MEYDFARIDYFISSITYPDTLKILPGSEQKIQQKFAIGDKNGVLQCLSIKDEEPIVQFKTLPGKPITSVQLASSSGANSDKIFAASGNEVKGYTRKGKLFFTVETALSETITSMSIMGSDLILCSGRTVIYYRDLLEMYSYVCEDRVLDIAVFGAPNSTRMRLLVLVANKGAMILENGKMVTRIYTSSGPSRLSLPPMLRHTTDIIAFYGAADGSLGYFHFESELTSKCLVEGHGLGSVVCLGWFFNNSGMHLAVGRNDGSIQLYLIDVDNLIDKPRLKYTYFCGEPVTSVCGGCIGSDENEILVSTYSGRIFALRSRRMLSPSYLNNAPPDALATRRSKLEIEIARLEKQMTIEREKYQRNTRSVNAGVSIPPLLDIQYELTGATRKGWQEANITSAVPLDMLFIYSSNKMDIETDSAAVLSMCSQQNQAAELLATIRCQAGTRRLWVRMRRVLDAENINTGSSRVFIYILPAGAPRVARLIKLLLAALPYYSQFEDPDSVEHKRSWCILRIAGGFSVAEITAWLAEILPGEMPRPAGNVSFARSHSLLGTILICRYQRGSVVFKSDNVSTISNMKDLMSYYSMKKNIRLDMLCDIPDECLLNSFKNIEDQFRMEFKKNKNNNLKQAISYLDLGSSITDEDSQPTLCEEYHNVWKSAQDSTTEIYFKEIVDSMEQWYLDWCKLSLPGKHYSNEGAQFRAALLECRLDAVERILKNIVPKT